MYRVLPLQDLDLPDLAPYRTMRFQHEQRKQGIFVAEGEKVVRRLLESHLEVVSLLLPEKWAGQYCHLLDRRPETFVVYTAEKRLLETLTGYSMYQGVLAVARIPPSISLEQAIQLSPAPRLFLAADNLASAENLGGLIRNCVAFGAHALIVGETTCSPFLRRSVRSSMGAIFKLPIVEPPSLVAALHSARARGCRSVAAHPHAEQKWLPQINFAGDTIIVLGSEGAGLTPEVLAACDEAAAIPIKNDVDSLNVGDAGAVFLYEACRQRSNHSHAA